MRIVLGTGALLALPCNVFHSAPHSPGTPSASASSTMEGCSELSQMDGKSLFTVSSFTVVHYQEQ